LGNQNLCIQKHTIHGSGTGYEKKQTNVYVHENYIMLVKLFYIKKIVDVNCVNILIQYMSARNCKNLTPRKGGVNNKIFHSINCKNLTPRKGGVNNKIFHSRFSKIFWKTLEL
jgi:hypothetical protein